MAAVKLNETVTTASIGNAANVGAGLTRWRRRTVDKDAALTLALAFIERVNREGWVLADFEREMYAAIAAIKEAILKRETNDRNREKPRPTARRCPSRERAA